VEAGTPAYVERVQPAVIGIGVRVPLDRPSALTLGPVRSESGVIFDPAGYALTVSYVLSDAEIIQVVLRDGRVVPGKLVGVDLEHGLGVLKLEGEGPWPFAPLGDSPRFSREEVVLTARPRMPRFIGARCEREQPRGGREPTPFLGNLVITYGVVF